MPLPQPNLDDKTFAALVAEATKLIPRHAPEWTDHNRHDPGITLIELFSWLAEMQQFYLNHVGDESYLKFLKLLGLKPRVAAQARAYVNFDKVPAGGILVPRGAKLSTEDGMVFETEEAMSLVAPTLERVLSSTKNTLKDSTDANGIEGLSFYAFGEESNVVGRRLYLGFDAPLPPHEEIFLTVNLYEGYRVARAEHGEEEPSVVPSALVGWEYYDDDDWRPLDFVAEMEYAMRTAGGVSDAAGGASCFKLKDEFVRAVHESFSYRLMPKEAREFFDEAAEAAGTASALRRALYDSPFLLSMGDETLMLSRSGRLRLAAPPSMTARVIHPFEDNLFWLRATVLAGSYELPPQIDMIRLNTVSAAQRDTSSEMIPFASDGSAGQSFSADGYLTLGGVNSVQVREQGGLWKDWEDKGSGEDPFAASGPNDEHYSIKKDFERNRLTLSFGDGVRGRIPPEGEGSIRLVSHLPTFAEPRMIGRSTGLPNQAFSLRQTGIVKDSLVVQVEERAKLDRVVRESKELACLLRFERAHEAAEVLSVSLPAGVKLYEVRITLEARQEICNVELRERLRGSISFRSDIESRCVGRFDEREAVIPVGNLRANEAAECSYFVEVGEAGGNIHGKVVISLAGQCPTVIEDSPTSVVEYEGEREEARWRDWVRVEDFDASGPSDPHFVLDACAGEVRFGDGVNGDIPQALASETEKNVRVISLQAGGGKLGNVTAASIDRFAKPFGVEMDWRLHRLEVSNPAAAWGGEDKESLEDAQARARRDLKTRHRAVTTEDIEYLATNTPGLRVARARAIPLFAPGGGGDLLNPAPASVTVVVVPYSHALKPFPSEGFVRTVCRHLDRHRLLTTRIHVIGPEYVGVGVRATVRLHAEFGQAETLARIEKSLGDFLSPLPADDDTEGEGWPFGRTVFRSEVYQLIENVSGVDCVEKVTLVASGLGVARSVEGNIVIPPQSLVYPAAHSIDVVTPVTECRSMR